MRATSLLMMAGLMLTTGAGQTRPADGEAEVRLAARQLLEAVKDKDAARLLDMYTPDAQLMTARNTTAGREAIRSHIASVFALGLSGVRTDEQEIFAGDGAAVETGKATFYGPGGMTLGVSRYMTLWKKLDGRWRIHRDLGVPVAGASAPPAAQP